MALHAHLHSRHLAAVCSALGSFANVIHAQVEECSATLWKLAGSQSDYKTRKGNK